jgi:hypothetical protein
LSTLVSSLSLAPYFTVGALVVKVTPVDLNGHAGFATTADAFATAIHATIATMMKILKALMFY